MLGLLPGDCGKVRTVPKTGIDILALLLGGDIALGVKLGAVVGRVRNDVGYGNTGMGNKLLRVLLEEVFDLAILDLQLGGHLILKLADRDLLANILPGARSDVSPRAAS